MPWQFISDSTVRTLPVAERFIAYAEAYAAAATALCSQMDALASTRTWPNAAVTLMLAAHAAELFLKGAILKRDADARCDGHCLEALADEYCRQFPEPEYRWNVPFKVAYVGVPEKEIEALRKSTPVPSVLYRYPVQRGGEDWDGLFGFEPGAFLLILNQMSTDFCRIKAKLA